jgi:alkylhydroperoxidase family enzyme
MSARRVVTRPHYSGDLMDEVLVYERSSLSENQKVALRLTDAFLVRPAGFSAAHRLQALKQFTTSELVELLLKLSAWTVNKSMTALRLDAAIDETRLTPFHYDAEGSLVLHLPGQ